MSHEFLAQQMTMTIRLLATGCFVHAQVKVEHPVQASEMACLEYFGDFTRKAGR